MVRTAGASPNALKVAFRPSLTVQQVEDVTNLVEVAIRAEGEPTETPS